MWHRFSIRCLPSTSARESAKQSAQFEEGIIWGAVDTRLLTGEGLLNGEFESFGANIWRASRTLMVLLGPSESVFGMENFLVYSHGF